jgi:LPXTG-site transpeptidase (sortase) family protein
MTKKKRFNLIDGLILLLIVAGIVVISYPFVSDAWVSYHNQQVIDQYQSREVKKNKANQQREYAKYQRANQKLATEGGTPGVNKFNQAVSNAHETQNASQQRRQKILAGETIADIVIPKIGVSLPIYDHTSDWLLQFGACRLDGTSYPTGGLNTNAVISAHRGVPNAELFTRLPELKQGDRFYIKNGTKTLAYQVVKKVVITPTDTDKLKIVPGKDLVTLMTCTPYMINSHRLLVIGKRVPFTKKDQQRAAWPRWWNKIKLALVGFATVLILFLLSRLLRYLIISRKEYQIKIISSVAAEITIKRRRKQILVAEVLPGVPFTKNLAGDRYQITIAEKDRVQKYRAYIKHIRDQKFTVKRIHK